MYRRKITSGFALSLAVACAIGSKAFSESSNTAPPSDSSGLAMLFQVVDQLQNCVAIKDLDSIHNEDVTLGVAVTELFGGADSSPDTTVFKTNLTFFSQRVADLHLAGDLKQQGRAERTLTNVLSALGQVQSCFPDEVVAEARRRAGIFMCPVHRDVTGARINLCPKCGTPLEQAVRILSLNAGASSVPVPIRASIRTIEPLVPGQAVTAFLQLAKPTSEPVLLPDLIESHTRKIHLLIMDESLTDYHHAHPQPTKTPGEYTFSFTPKNPGSYRVWADIRPHPLGLQQYAIVDIPSPIAGVPTAKSAINLKTNMAGLNWELILPADGIEVGRSAVARLRITDGRGDGVTQLEPFMAAFAHLVGFQEDRMTILHMHPRGLPVTDPDLRGGPELEFQIFALKSGYIRLFAQVQIGGESRFAAFTIGIKPAGSIPAPIQQERQLVPFNLVERSGRTVTQEDFAGKIVLVNLMFTGCSLSSGEVIHRMADFQRRTANMPDVLIASLTIDPQSDTPDVLKDFATTYGADTNRWLFLTGSKTEVRQLIRSSFFPPTPDANQSIRDSFNGLDTITLLDQQGRVIESFEGLNPNVVNSVMPFIEKRRVKIAPSSP